MISLYCTSDRIELETGAGAVTRNELEALWSVSDDVFVLSGSELAPSNFGQPDSPFLPDYFALEQVAGKHFDLAHFFSGTFTQTVRYLKGRGTKVSYMIDAHDKELSIQEFNRLGLQYPFRHVSDDNLWQIYTEGYRLADVVIAASNRSAQILKSIGCRNVVVIPHGVNLPEQVEPIPENFDVAYVGAIGPDKSLVDLIQAWGLLDYPDSRLILAGMGTEALTPFIRQVTDKGNFLLLGRVPNVADVYNSCSVYVHASVTEGFGLEIPEAMSYGRPVVASEGAGASELITDGVDGFVVPVRDPRAIAERIDYLKRNREKMLEMGQRARRKAESYTWDKIRARYCEIFNLLKERNENRA